MEEQCNKRAASRAEFLRQAAEAYDRMMVEDQEQVITFEQIEDRALEVGRKLNKRLVEERLAEAARSVAGGQTACPKCGKPLQMVSPKAREIRSRSGPIKFQRAEGYCPSCRKAFFPSGRTAETRGRELQPRAAAQNS